MERRRGEDDMGRGTGGRAVGGSVKAEQTGVRGYML